MTASPTTNPATDADLAIEKLTVEYSSGGYAVRPIDALDLNFRSGELVILLGASGCGKSTLLSVLSGILTPNRGSVRLGDQEIVGLRGGELTRYRRHTVGIVFQAFNLVSSLSVCENVMLPMLSGGVRKKPARARAVELLSSIGLEERLHHKPNDMSGGQQQRVAIARALAHNPPLLLADEPTAHLDYIQVEGVLRLLRTLASPGRIVVVATHDERLVPLADRVVELTPRAVNNNAPPEQVHLSAGSILFEQGEPGERVYVVETGEMELYRRLAGGGEELLAISTPGDYFGELAPIFGLRRATTARARTDVTLTSYSVRDFRTQLAPGALAEVLNHASDAVQT